MCRAHVGHKLACVLFIGDEFGMCPETHVWHVITNPWPAHGIRDTGPPRGVSSDLESLYSPITWLSRVLIIYLNFLSFSWAVNSPQWKNFMEKRVYFIVSGLCLLEWRIWNTKNEIKTGYTNTRSPNIWGQMEEDWEKCCLEEEVEDKLE